MRSWISLFITTEFLLLDHQNNPYPPQHKVYGGKAGLNVQHSTTTTGAPSVVFEFSEKKSGRYCWDTKTVFQLTPQELPELAAYFWWPWDTNAWQHLRSSAPKTLEVQNTSDGVVIGLYASGRRPTLKLTKTDQYHLRNLLTSQLIAAQPSLPYDLHIDSLKALARSFQSNK